MVPDHQVIRYAAEQDYDGFYDLEIQLRRVQNAPPFGDLAAVVVTGREETAVLRGAAKFRDSLIACLRQEAYREERCAVLGPAPCAVPKVNYHFRYQLTLPLPPDPDNAPAAFLSSPGVRKGQGKPGCQRLHRCERIRLTGNPFTIRETR